MQHLKRRCQYETNFNHSNLRKVARLFPQKNLSIVNFIKKKDAYIPLKETNNGIDEILCRTVHCHFPIYYVAHNQTGGKEKVISKARQKVSKKRAGRIRKIEWDH